MKLEGPVKKPLAIMLATAALTVLLSGCAVAMLGGASRSGGSTASGGSSASGSSGTASPAGRPAAKIAADNSISTAVRSRFGANASLKPLKLTVDTHDGVVTLRGQVNTVDQRNAAQLEARAVKGVKAVKNELTVR
jgi:hyperosmotically inducible periplasmic protein